MAQEGIKTLLDKLSQDEDFRTGFFQIKDEETMRRVLAENGAPTDQQQFAKAVFESQVIAMPDEALAAISGGLSDKYDFKNNTGFIDFVGGVGKLILNKTILASKPLDYTPGQKNELEFWRLI